MNYRKTNDLVLDLETTSLNPNTAILSIALVPVPKDLSVTTTDEYDTKWDYIETDSFYRNISLESCFEKDMAISASTFYWWLERNEKARRELIDTPKYEIETVLKQAKEYIQKFPDNVYIWSHKDLDTAVLRTSYRKLKINPPFDKEQMMDMRTLKLLKNVKKDDSDKEGKHIAIKDAINEAKLVHKALYQK